MSSGVHDGSTSSKLLRLLREQDAAAWRELVRIYTPQVYNDCRLFGLPPREAADVAQEVFRSVFSSMERFVKKSEGDSFRKWLRGITRNKVRDYFRREQNEAMPIGGSTAHRRLHELEIDLAEESLGSDRAELVQLRRVLLNIEGDFEAHTWRAFWTTTVDGRKATDVADELGMTPVAVRKAKSRVMAQLREELGRL